MDLINVEKLIALMTQYDLSELKVAEKDWEFSARRGDKVQAPIVVAAPLSPAASGVLPAAAPVAAPTASAPRAANLKEITAPIVGTFYRAAAPDQPPFKEVGDSVSADDVVCIVEAMKVMNEIKAGVSGKLRRILVDNASPVEYGQALFLVEAGG